MIRSIAILGSTGSIGTQALSVLRALREQNKSVEVIALAAGRNVSLLAQQIKEFHVKLASVECEGDVPVLRQLLDGADVEIVSGAQGLMRVASVQTDMLLTAIVGMRGLLPTLAAIDRKTDIALANKETMVVAGRLVTEAARTKGVRILPVDSEHSAILQCLMGNDRDRVEKLILTASGGPFRAWSPKKSADVTMDAVLAHPTWKMGGKITVDCADMINKGLEVIEARWLFDMPYEKISVVVHPQSIVHSMVQYIDGAVIAQLGVPDMKIPIQLAMSYPERLSSDFARVDFPALGTLSFEAPDPEKFPCLRLAGEAARCDGTMPAVMNGANEVAVEKFFHGDIKFAEIPYIIEKAMQAHAVISNPCLEEILEADLWARSFVGGL